MSLLAEARQVIDEQTRDEDGHCTWCGAHERNPGLALNNGHFKSCKVHQILTKIAEVLP